MFKRSLTVAAALALSAGLLGAAPSAHAVDYSQSVKLVREKQSTFGSSTWVGSDGQGWTFAKSSHNLEMRVFRVEEELPNFNIYIAEVTMGREYVTRPNTPYAWKRVSIETPKKFDKRIKLTSYTQSLVASNSKDSSCYNASASLNAGVGPIGGSLSISKAVFCDKNDKTRIAARKVNFRKAQWKAVQSGAVKQAVFQKIIKIPANTQVPFVVRTKAPCHYSDQFGELQLKTCYATYKLKYPAHA